MNLQISDDVAKKMLQESPAFRAHILKWLGSISNHCQNLTEQVDQLELANERRSQIISNLERALREAQSKIPVNGHLPKPTVPLKDDVNSSDEKRGDFVSFDGSGDDGEIIKPSKIEGEGETPLPIKH